MKILSSRTLYGPNVYHSHPVIITTVDLEEWTDIPSNEIPHFTENLIGLLPGLKNHHCSRGHENGFIERLREGTYMAHIIEHIALEFSVLCGIEVFYGKTRYAGAVGKYEIATRFLNEDGMKACMSEAILLAQAAATSIDFDVQATVQKIRIIIRESSLGPSAQALLDAAKKKNIPIRRVGKESLLRLGYSKKMKRVQTAVTECTGLLAADIAQDKNWTKSLLKENFLPVPEGVVVTSASELDQALTTIRGPYAIKPLNGNHGNGVALNLTSRQDVFEAFEISKRHSPQVLIEEMCPGNDYRILVVNGKMIAAAQRIPPCVKGDGESTIKALIEELNLDPRRGNGHENVMTKIEVDDVMMACLHKLDLTLESVLKKDQVVMLRANANLSSGGHAIDVTSRVHPEVITLCERTARIVGLDICGIDLIHQNISQPVNESVKIIEVNAGPGLRMHLSPSEGSPQPVAEAIINMLFPIGEHGRIPIVSVTGTNGKTTVVRMLHKILSEVPDRTVGLTTTDGIWIGSEKIFSGDTTGPQSSQVVLTDPKVDMAVLEVARGGLLRGGLAYDWSDVSVITNIRHDHIGQDGIEDLDDLIWIKSVVAERVRENGVLVLNADDEASLNLRDNPKVMRVKKHICLYSINAQNAALRTHKITGGSACWVENDWIYVQHGIIFDKVIKVTDIPATLNGIADFQVSNALAAIGAAVAAGASISQIVKGLKAFQPMHENMGRLNIYKVLQGYVILDYGHNADAIAAVGRMLSRLPGYTKTAVFGMPGDRADRLIQNGGETIAHCFDRFILKDDDDLRGREPHQTPKIIQAAILNRNPGADTKIIPNQIEAIHYALQNIKPNEIVGIFYEKLNSVMPVLLQYDPQPIDMIPPLRSETSFKDSNRKELEHARTL